MKKLLAVIVAFSLVLTLSMSTTAYASSNNHFLIYSQDCPTAAIEFAEENFLPFLTSSIEGDALQVGDIIQLGSPFTIQPQSLDTVVYYFPIISDGTIIGTFRIYKDTSTNEYVGIMSKFLADELSSLDTISSTPALLFMDEGNIMVSIGDKVDVLMHDPHGTPPSNRELPPIELSAVDPMIPLDTISTSELSIPFSISKYLNLDLIETQGDEEWCFAYAASSIIRYVNGTTTPKALDVMKIFYLNPKPENMLSVYNVVGAGAAYGLNPIYATRCVPAFSEIDANRPVFIRCQRTSETGSKKYHALVIRGYNISTNVYSIWNPWNSYYESISISTNQYITGDRTYTWIETIYNWVK